MIVQFFKSLDRPVSIFGLKGKWITLFLVVVGICLFMGFLAGAAAGTGVGICVVLGGGVLAFLGCYAAQGKVNHRDIGKVNLASRCRTYVRRKETLARIILEGDDSPSWFLGSQTEREKRNNSEVE